MNCKSGICPHKFARAAAAAGFAALLIAVPGAGAAGVKEGIRLCLESLIPSLFPFIFVADYLQSSLDAALGGRFRLMSAALLSACGGFVSGAACLKKLCGQGAVDKADASRLLAAYTNAGPAFVVGAVGTGMFGSPAVGYIMLAALYLSSAAVFLAFGGLRVKVRPAISALNPPSVAGSLACSVKTTAGLCGSVLLFCCVGAYLRLLPLGEKTLAALCCLIEVTGGCSAAAALRDPYLAAAAVSVFSLSIVIQISSVLRGSGISIRPLLFSRLLHLPVSLALFRLLLSAAGGVQAVFAAPGQVEIFSLSPMFSLFLFLCAAAALLQGRPEND